MVIFNQKTVFFDFIHSTYIKQHHTMRLLNSIVIYCNDY